MAGVTYTYTPQMGGQARATVDGLNVLPIDYKPGGTNKFGTLSDVALLGKIPNGALITDWYLNFTTLSEAVVMELVLLATEASGTYSVYATLDSSLTASATAAITSVGYRPIKVSLSDDRAVQHVVLALNVSTGASGTVSFSTYGTLKYLTNGSPIV